MHKANQKSLATLVEEMYRAHLRGAVTKEDYYREGFSDEEINAASAGVARKVREAEQAAA